MQNLIKQKKQFMVDRGWNNLNPGDLAKSIIVEGAELLELFQWTNPSKDEVSKDVEKMKKIKEELADVFIYALDLAITLNIDPEEIILKKMEENSKKFPVKKMTTDNWHEDYIKIKEKKRKEEKNN